MERDNKLFVVAGALALVAIVFFGWRWLSSPAPPSPEKLAALALSGTPEQSQEAALKLSALGGPAVPHIRRVLAESKSPEVRAAMIQGLIQQRDYTSMPAILDAMDDASLLVRVRSAPAVQYLLGFAASYLPNDPPEKRQAAVQACRQRWELMLSSPRMQKRLAAEQTK